MKIKNMTYKALRISNDINAIRRGKIGQRIGRRATGKITGRLMNKLLK